MRFLSFSKSAGLLVIAIGLNATLVASLAFSQSAQDQGKVSGSTTGSGKADTLTGGAEAAPTNQATPSPSSGGDATSSLSGNSGKGNTFTGGAEAAPTDQATPASATTTVPSGPSSRPADPPPNMKPSQSE
jgi:hypothetical protein